MWGMGDGRDFFLAWAEVIGGYAASRTTPVLLVPCLHLGVLLRQGWELGAPPLLPLKVGGHELDTAGIPGRALGWICQFTAALWEEGVK